MLGYINQIYVSQGCLNSRNVDTLGVEERHKYTNDTRSIEIVMMCSSLLALRSIITDHYCPEGKVDD